ncbi:unnamed protein product [Auanema sp. JU1783]|nr:unnamed protein product [Auanema sp. JU1783]
MVLISLLICSLAIAKNLENPVNDQKAEEDKDNAVLIQNGQLSLKDSEITLLINSTFEIIEDFENNSTVSEVNSITNETVTDTLKTTEPPMTTVSPLPHPRSVPHKTRFQKLRPTAENCRQFSIREKYGMLERAGGRNQLFMAETPEEASKGFTSLYGDENEMSLADDVQSEVDIDFCDSRCETIKSQLELALTNRYKSAEAKSLKLHDDTLTTGDQLEVDEGDISRSCFLDSFVPIGNCSNPGEDDSWTHDTLCSECRGIYLLNKECFPTFFNTVRCNSQDNGCIFDTFSDRAHGECNTQSLSFKVLRNRGNSQCEDWVVENIELPVACQCMLSKSSWLRSRPPKEL